MFVRGGEIDRPSSSSSSSSAAAAAAAADDGMRTSITRAPSPDPGSPSFTRPVRRVTVVGGTHGNEYTGVWCIKAIEGQREVHRRRTAENSANDGGGEGGRRVDDRINVFEKFQSLEIDTLLGNPVAYMQNKRFVDVDLNREFSIEKLLKVPDDGGFINMKECDVRTQFCSNEIRSSLPHEAVRAREIEALLGPKFTAESTSAGGGGGGFDSSYGDPNADVVIDLHTTTANMGISLIIPEGDALMSAAAAHVLHECRSRYGENGAQCLMHALPRRQDRMNLSSCGRHGFTIEVGPTPQGVLRHDCVEKTQAALHALLEFFHLRNLELEEWRTTNGGGGDGANGGAPPPSPTLDRLARLYPGGVVPCYRSAPAVRPGELSGKICWPNDASNPNFPALMVHNSVQDRDFGELRVGDPLFVELDGTVVPYDGSHGDVVHVIFVNEGGYYYESSGTGVGVAVRSQFDLQTGECCVRISLTKKVCMSSHTPVVVFCNQTPAKTNLLTFFVHSTDSFRIPGWFLVESDDEDGASEEIVVEESDSYE